WLRDLHILSARKSLPIRLHITCFAISVKTLRIPLYLQGVPGSPAASRPEDFPQAMFSIPGERLLLVYRQKNPFACLLHPITHSSTFISITSRGSIAEVLCLLLSSANSFSRGCPHRHLLSYKPEYCTSFSLPVLSPVLLVG